MPRVVIVGAGPTGVTLALLLARRGIAVTLIEAARSFQRSFRGEGLMPAGLEALQQMGLAAILDRIPHRALDAWEFWIDQHYLFRVAEPIEPGGQPCTLVSQPALLAAIMEEASTYPHFEFIQGQAVQALQWQDQRVAGVTLGQGRSIAADLVIGTDGRNSVLRQQAGLSLESQAHPFNLLWFQLDDSPQFAASNRFYVIVQGQNAFGLFRSAEGRLQVGWSVPAGDSTDWKQVNWPDRLAAASPPWLAAHFRSQAETIDRPVLLSVVVGLCPQWSVPGLLLLGDAAHPMSPIRAQGINVALRDVIVAANHLVPLLQTTSDPAAIDAVLPNIQAERVPEIERAQHLQAAEAAQADLLTQNALLQWGASRFAPLIRGPVRYAWLRRQRQLRQGVTPVQLQI